MSAAAVITDQQWFTTREVCEYTRTSERTLLRHIAKGALRPDARARPGLGVHRFRRATLDAWLMGEAANDK